MNQENRNDMPEKALIGLLIDEVKQIREEQAKTNEKVGDMADVLATKLDRFIGRVNTWFVVGLSFFLFLIGGSFMYTSRVEDEQNDVKKIQTSTREKLHKYYEGMSKDLATISFHLYKEDTSSLSLKEMFRKYNSEN